MALQAFSSVAHPGLAEITNRADHSQAGGEHAHMLDDTVARFKHALYFAALGANG